MSMLDDPFAFADPFSEEVGHDLLSVDDISPSPENDTLYRPVSLDDPEIRALADSIVENGLLEPIVVTLDNWILSGHRRYAACRLAGLDEIPCRYESIYRTKEPDAFVARLREFNRQREKTLAEKFREEIVSADPEDSHRRLILQRRAERHVPVIATRLRGVTSRKTISDAKQPMLAAIKRVFRERREFLPLTVRAIHYALLNAPPLRHAAKPDSTYANDLPSYKSLDELLTRARIAGIFPMEWIRDDTRPVTIWDVHQEPRTFIRRELDGFMKGYCRDLMQSQPNHIEVLGEKNTVDPILRAVVSDYCIPMTTGRGYSSLPPRAAMAQRYTASGKGKLILLVISDFDPDGEEICHSFARSMRDDFGVPKIHPIKVALTASQVRERSLPPSMDAKVSSPNFKRFSEKHGLHAYELEAIQPGDLQQILRDAIDSVIDRDAFEHEFAQEAQDAAKLDGIRDALHSAMKHVDADGREDSA